MPTLQIDCTNIRNQVGQLLAVVWDSRAKFRSEDSADAFRAVKIKVPPGAAKIDLGDLPEGEYAVAVLHDENLNEKLDVSRMLGLPVEGVAYSNNPRMGLKGPTWDTCRIKHTANDTIAIRLRYWL